MVACSHAVYITIRGCEQPLHGYAVTLAEHVRAQILQETSLSVLAMAGQATSGGTLDLLV